MSRRGMGARHPARLYSPRLLAAFQSYLPSYLGRHFNAVRVARSGQMPRLERPTVIYSNHASWWDPLVLLLVSGRCLSGARIFAPIDARALERYSILARLGFFPIEPGTVAGARAFLETATQLLAMPATAIAVAAQGRFADPRERPIALQRGVSRLLADRSDCDALPIAAEYPFWEERLPEALLRFGSVVRAEPDESPDALHRRLERALETTMDELAFDAARRDPAHFQPLLSSRRQGVGFVYDTFERLRNRVKGRSFERAHRSIDS